MKMGGVLQDLIQGEKYHENPRGAKESNKGSQSSSNELHLEVKDVWLQINIQGRIKSGDNDPKISDIVYLPNNEQ